MEKETVIWTAHDVADYLQISVGQAYNIMKRDELKSIRVGKRNIRTTTKAVNEYLNKVS